MSNINRMVFDTSDESESALFTNFLNALLEYNRTSRYDYNDIHISQEESLIVLEWVQIPFDGEWGGKFEFVDDDQQVVTEVTFPDGSYDYAFNQEEKNTMLDKWFKEHPQWKRSPYRGWYENTEEVEAEDDFDIEKNNSAEAGNATGEN